MAICKICGFNSDDNSKFCPQCGTKLEIEPVAQEGSQPEASANENNPPEDIPVYEGEVNDTNTYTQNDSGFSSSSDAAYKNVDYPQNSINVGLLVWSIANAVIGFFGSCICFPLPACILGVISIIYTTLAKNAKDEKSQQSDIKIAKILNIIASAILCISIIISFILLVVSIKSTIKQPQMDLDTFIQTYPYK